MHFEFGAAQYPYIFFIIISLFFPILLESWLEKSITNSLPPGSSSTDIVNYTFDGHSRLSFLMTTLGAIPYFLWDLLQKGMSPTVTYIVLIVFICLLVGSFVLFQLHEPPKFRTDEWHGYRTGTWAAFAEILINLLLLFISTIHP